MTNPPIKLRSTQRRHPGRRYVAVALAGAALATLPSVAAAGAAQGDEVVARALVGLQRDTAGLNLFASRVSNPASPQYRRYMSVPDIAARYGARPATVSRARRSLAAAGLTGASLDVTRGFLVVPVTAAELTRLQSSSGAMERLKGAPVTGVVTQPAARALHEKAAPVEARETALSAPGWPSRTGTPRGCAQGVSTPTPPSPQAAAAFPASKVFTPNQFQAAFGMSGLHRSGVQGQGRHIALFEVDAGYKAEDMAAFAQCFGLPAPRLRAVPVGQSTPVSPFASTATVEAQLDIQAVMIAAPRARISVVQGNAGASMPEIFSVSLDARRMRGVPDVISSSYGVCEPLAQSGAEAPFINGPQGRQLTDWVLATAAGAGVSVVVAAGDSGAQSCAHNVGSVPGDVSGLGPLTQVTTNYVEYPSSSPWITAVGGTSMTLTRDNRIRTQKPWNDRTSLGTAPIQPTLVGGLPVLSFPAGGGSGGSSMLYATPSYQVRAGITSNRRLVPDVSMYASWGIPLVCSVFNPATGSGPCPPTSASWPFMSVAGTSFAAPLLAGGLALVNQRAVQAGQPTVGFVNPLLYSAGAPAINDVTTGDNDVFDTGRCCFAGPGYDQATGLGTVNAGRLAQVAVRAGARG